MRRQLRRLYAWCKLHQGLIGYLVLAVGIGIGFYFLNQTRQALCALKKDQGARIEAQQDSIDRAHAFLDKHPKGAFGFSRSDIQIQIDAQQRLLANLRRNREALEKLWCGKGT